MATDPSRSYDGSAPLGQGGYGSVFLGEFEGRKAAVKRVEVFRIGNDNEEKALKQLDHPNIVKLFYSEKDNNFKYFYLELCDASLDQVFLRPDNPKKYKGPPLPRYTDVFRQLALGLEHIHSKNLIHRDIKPENVLISVRSNDQVNDITIKWADFGLSKSVNERGTCTLSGVKGTKNWFAPELLKLLLDGRKTIEARGSVKSDVFSLGLVFGYLLLDGKHLYGSNEFQIKKNIIKKQMPMDVLEKLKECCGDEILGLMLKDDPNERITSTNIVLGLKLMEDKLSSKVRELIQKSSPDLIERIKHFSRLGFDVNAKDEYGRNALHHLCEYNSNSNLIDAIRLLIQLEIDVNAKDFRGWNALHYLCWKNSNSNLIDAIQLLIRKGIDFNAKSDDGQNALHYLCGNNSNSNLIDGIRLLIQLGIDVNAKDKYGRNALHHLCRYNSNSNLLDAIRLLIHLGIDVNAKDNGGWNALHLLCRFNSNSNLIDAIQLLIREGIYVNAKDKGGWNALHHLCGFHSNPNLIDAIRLFIQLGIPVVSDGNDARSILCWHYEIKNKDEILKLLDEAALGSGQCNALSRR